MLLVIAVEKSNPFLVLIEPRLLYLAKVGPAFLETSLNDLQILLPEATPAPESATRALPALSDEERRVYEAIRETETSIDDIATNADLPSGTVSSILLRLELKKLVKQLPGKYFVKLG